MNNTIVDYDRWASFDYTKMNSKHLFNAIAETNSSIKAPTGVSISPFIAAANIVVQNKADVYIPLGEGVRKPISMYIMTLAPSGERKSAVQEKAFKPVREHEKSIGAAFDEKVEEYKHQENIWRHKQKRLDALYQRALKADEPTVDIEKQMRGHQQERPKQPIKEKIIFEDSSHSALFDRLSIPGSSAGIVSAEGGSVLNSGAFSSYTLLNSVWSGESCHQDRKNGGELTIDDTRLMISISMQPEIFAAHLKKNFDSFRGSGFASRLLVINAGSRQGSRFDSGLSSGTEHLDKYYRRCYEILSEDKGDERQLMRFSHEAALVFKRYCNWANDSVLPGNNYAHIKDYMSKAPENLARLAATIQYFEHGFSDISEDSLSDAIEIFNFSIRGFNEVFCPPPQDIADSIIVDRWLDTFRSKNQRYLQKNAILQVGPSQIRKKSRVDPALMHLINAGRVRLMRSSRNGAIFLDLFPWAIPVVNDLVPVA